MEKPAKNRKRDLVFERPANDTSAETIQLSANTRERVAQVLAEIVAESMLRRASNDEAK